MGLSVKVVGVREGFASVLKSVDFVIFLHYYPRQKAFYLLWIFIPMERFYRHSLMFSENLGFCVTVTFSYARVLSSRGGSQVVSVWS